MRPRAVPWRWGAFLPLAWILSSPVGETPTDDVCAATAGGPVPAVAEIESESLRRLREERAERGVTPDLEDDARLALLARRYSEAMRDGGFFSHTSPEGLDPAARLSAAGYLSLAVGENIARVDNVRDPARCAHRVLMESAGHRENILSPEFTRIGVGAATEGRSVWITQLFATR